MSELARKFVCWLDAYWHAYVCPAVERWNPSEDDE